MIGKRVCFLAALIALSLAAGCGRSLDPAYVCPAARGIGTVSPAVSIYSITFLVNGIEQVVLENHVLQAAPGDEVQIRGVIICAGSFSSDGGQACVDFAPTDENGQVMMSEHKGTDTAPVIPGFMTFSDLNFTWTVDENWGGFYVVLNHWTPVETQDLDCASGGCERDDWLNVEFH